MCRSSLLCSSFKPTADHQHPKFARFMFFLWFAIHHFCKGAWTWCVFSPHLFLKNVQGGSGHSSLNINRRPHWNLYPQSMFYDVFFLQMFFSTSNPNLDMVNFHQLVGSQFFVCVFVHLTSKCLYFLGRKSCLNPHLQKLWEETVGPRQKHIVNAWLSKKTMTPILMEVWKMSVFGD